MRRKDVFALAYVASDMGMSSSGNVSISNRYSDGKMISALRSWPDR